MKIVINFLYFLKQLFKHRHDPFAKKDIVLDRQRICLSCVKLNDQGLLSKLKGPRCSICGCFMFEKTKFKFELCPDKPPKWSIDV